MSLLQPLRHLRPYPLTLRNRLSQETACHGEIGGIKDGPQLLMQVQLLPFGGQGEEVAREVALAALPSRALDVARERWLSWSRNDCRVLLQYLWALSRQIAVFPGNPGL